MWQAFAMRAAHPSCLPAFATLVAMFAPAAPAVAATDAPLRGMTVVLDPGHNGANARAPAAINRLVGIGKGVRKGL